MCWGKWLVLMGFRVISWTSGVGFSSMPSGGEASRLHSDGEVTRHMIRDDATRYSSTGEVTRRLTGLPGGSWLGVTKPFLSLGVICPSLVDGSPGLQKNEIQV